MNYLAHLHIASYCRSDLLGNLAADFIRGKPDGRFPTDVTAAIYLHRFVDRHTDAMPDVKQCRQLFSRPLYRYSAIALDIYWDHFLARHWQDYCDLPLARFLKQAEEDCRNKAARLTGLPERFHVISNRMWKEQWIQSYRDADTVPFVLSRMATRSPRMSPLAGCGQVFEQHYDQLELSFHKLYPKVLADAKVWWDSHNKKWE